MIKNSILPKPKAFVRATLIILALLKGGMIKGREQNIALRISPEIVRLGKNVRILAAAELNLSGLEIAVAGTSGLLPVVNRRSAGGPPFWWSGQTQIIEDGAYAENLYSAWLGMIRGTSIVLDGRSPQIRIVAHIPNPGRHTRRSYGAYSNRSRVTVGVAQDFSGCAAHSPADDEDSEFTRETRPTWSRLLRKIFEIDPLL